MIMNKSHTDDPKEIKLIFSTQDALNNGAVFNSGILDIRGYQQVQTHILASHTGSIEFIFHQLQDGSNIVRTITVPYSTANSFELFSAPAFSDFVQYKFTNDSGSNQTNFHFETKVLLSALSPQILDLEAFISPSMTSQLNRSVIVAKKPDDTYVNVGSTDNGALKVQTGITDTFGQQITSSYTPLVQSYYNYGVPTHSQLYREFKSGGGTIASNTEGNAIDLSISTAIGDFAVSRSRRVMKYYAGFSNVIRINATFDGNAVANSLQFAGVGNAESDLYFCYSGANFGIRRSTGGLLEVRKLTITGASTGTETATVTLNGTAYSVNLINAGGDVNFTAHQVEVGNAYGGLWNIDHIGDTVIFVASDVGARSGTYSFSSASATGTFSQTKAGSALTTTFVPQGSWNGSSDMVSNLDPTQANMYSIRYSWYGSGNIYYDVMNPSTGEYENVHYESFANTTTDYSLSAPNLFIQRGIASLGSTTALSMSSSGSFGATIGNINLNKAPIYGITSTKSISSNTETNLITISNRRTINGYANQSEIYLDDLSFVADGNKSVEFRVILNPTSVSANTTGDYHSYQYINESESLTIYDTSSLTYTGGTTLFTFLVAKTGGLEKDLADKEIYLAPGDEIVISALSTNASDVEVAVELREDF